MDWLQAHPLPLPPRPLVSLQPSMSPQSTINHHSMERADASPMKNHWKKGKLIGRGTFGSVYIGTNRKTGALCAMKEVDLVPDDPKSADCINQLEQNRFLLDHRRRRAGGRKYEICGGRGVKRKFRVGAGGRMRMKSKAGRSSSKKMKVEDEELYCYCGIPAAIRTSKTKVNPGRWFAECGNYRLGWKCEFFCWLDDEQCEVGAVSSPGEEQINLKIRMEVDMKKVLHRNFIFVLVIIIGVFMYFLRQ